MKIDNDLSQMISFAIGYMLENADMTDSQLAKLQPVLDGIEPWLSSNEGDDDSVDQVIDELIKNIESIQEKIDAYGDLEYSEGD